MEPNKGLPDDVKKQLLRQFESHYPQLEIELRTLLSKHENDLLDKSKVEDMLGLFSNRLTVLQYDFLQSIQSNDKTVNVSRCNYSDDQVAEIVAGLTGAVGTASALSFISWTTATTTWFFWTTTTTVTAGSALGGLIGTSAGLATGGAALVVGGVLGYIVYKSRLKSRRNHIKEQILKHWETVIKPELTDWAKKQINAIG